MPTIALRTVVDAPPDRVFDLARSVEMHTESMAASDERAVAGVTEGLLDAGDRVTWRARHFGVPFELTVELTAFDRPRHFRDEQVAGPFEAMCHDHYFEAIESDGETPRTRMRDEFCFRSPLGPLGTLADRAVLERYVTRLLTERNVLLKRVAENGDVNE
ncbi:SRPBCC family protein [Halomarina rubra]|uniref:SRPBCC family protein n=1 Tax=Halomarina rubra TaxID=2071873 RepID=A0ABD6AY05_9EURY